MEIIDFIYLYELYFLNWEMFRRTWNYSKR